MHPGSDGCPPAKLVEGKDYHGTGQAEERGDGHAHLSHRISSVQLWVQQWDNENLYLPEMVYRSNIKKKPIHTKKYTVYLNQQSNIHWDVLHANAWRHSTTKNIFTYTRINATQYLNAKSTKWLLHLLFLTNKTLCWEKVNEATAENTAQQDKNHSSASWERCGSGLIGKLVLEVPHSDRKRLEDRFYPEHREHKILLPGTDLTWNRSLRILMRGWEMQWWRQHEGKAPGKC